MNMWVFPSFLSAGGALFLGTLLYLRKASNPTFAPMALLMGVLFWIHGLNGIITVFPEHFFLGKQYILLGELVLPIGLSYVTSTFLRHLSPHSSQEHQSKFLLIGVGAIILGVWFLASPDSIIQQTSSKEIVFSPYVGRLIWGFILLALVIGLSQLEQILRTTPDPLRFQMKFVLIGLGGLAGVSIAQASQLLLLPVWTHSAAWFAGMATCISLALIAFGLMRWRLHDLNQKVLVSHRALYTSLTFLFVGGYLILVGIVAEVIKETGWEIGEALGTLLVFVAGIALVIVVASRHARAELRRFVSRHFFRTKYDYRQKWLEVTETFSDCDDSEQVWDRYLECLARTFSSPRVTLWKRFDVDSRFHQIRTVNSEDPPSPISGTHEFFQRMVIKNEPFILDAEYTGHPELTEFFRSTEAHICVPLVTPAGSLLGFCTLSRELHDQSYDHDDFDLLRAIAHHVTILLIQFQLLEERSVTAKWEAVHKFSGFYLHDLKNLASSLSLVVQNAERYGHDPDFQVSAMGTVRKTSQRIMDLMAKLASQSKGPEMEREKNIQKVDINALIEETLESFNGTGCQPIFHPESDLPKLFLQKESIRQVLLNVILNARQAIGEKGCIDIFTAFDGQVLKVEIVDTGPGISTAQLEKLFQPFKSSKKTGLGVGLFQCKQMVEENHGQIHIESQQGHGTKVILTFPAKTADK